MKEHHDKIFTCIYEKWATWKRFILSFNLLGIHEDMHVTMMVVIIVAISSHEYIYDTNINLCCMVSSLF